MEKVLGCGSLWRGEVRSVDGTGSLEGEVQGQLALSAPHKDAPTHQPSVSQKGPSPESDQGTLISAPPQPPL